VLRYVQNFFIYCLFVRGVVVRLILNHFDSVEHLYVCGVLKNIVTLINKFVNFLLFAVYLCNYIISHFTRPKKYRVENISVTDRKYS
jgi:hypothetical protein